MFRIVTVLILILVAGCSANLDAECADQFEHVNDVLGNIASAQNINDLDESVAELDSFSKDVISLRKKARERLNDPDFLGKLCSELAYEGMDCKETVVLDNLNMRKTLALTQFKVLWRKIGAMQETDGRFRSDEGQLIFNRLKSQTLDELLALSFLCNKTLR